MKVQDVGIVVGNTAMDTDTVKMQRAWIRVEYRVGFFEEAEQTRMNAKILFVDDVECVIVVN